MPQSPGTGFQSRVSSHEESAAASAFDRRLAPQGKLLRVVNPSRPPSTPRLAPSLRLLGRNLSENRRSSPCGVQWMISTAVHIRGKRGPPKPSPSASRCETSVRPVLWPTPEKRIDQHRNRKRRCCSLDDDSNGRRSGGSNYGSGNRGGGSSPRHRRGSGGGGGEKPGTKCRGSGGHNSGAEKNTGVVVASAPGLDIVAAGIIYRRTVFRHDTSSY